MIYMESDDGAGHVRDESAYTGPLDSNLTVDDAILRCRQLGDRAEGNGWRRLLWRCADLLEALQRGE